MKILLISDTHGDLSRVYKIWERLSGIDMIIHCGDHYSDALELEDNLNVPVTAVCGNCDSSGGIMHQIVQTPAGRILVTHGHLENVDSSPNGLLYLAEENDCVAACFGHTHIPFNEDFNGIQLINPGSISRPRDGSSGSYAILHADDLLYANIVYYKESVSENGSDGGSRKKEKVRGGYLRGLLNYSDRF